MDPPTRAVAAACASRSKAPETGTPLSMWWRPASWNRAVPDSPTTRRPAISGTSTNSTRSPTRSRAGCSAVDVEQLGAGGPDELPPARGRRRVDGAHLGGQGDRSSGDLRARVRAASDRGEERVRWWSGSRTPARSRWPRRSRSRPDADARPRRPGGGASRPRPPGRGRRSGWEACGAGAAGARSPSARVAGRVESRPPRGPTVPDRPARQRGQDVGTAGIGSLRRAVEGHQHAGQAGDDRRLGPPPARSRRHAQHPLRARRRGVTAARRAAPGPRTRVSPADQPSTPPAGPRRRLCPARWPMPIPGGAERPCRTARVPGPP